jgi:hypothetical protein
MAYHILLYNAAKKDSHMSFYCFDVVRHHHCATEADNGSIAHPCLWYMSVKQRWNDTDKRKSKDSEKNLSQFHFVHHKSYMDCPRQEHVPPR